GDGGSPAIEDTITGLHRADVEAAAEAPVAFEAEPPPPPPAPVPARARRAGPPRRRKVLRRTAIAALLAIVLAGAVIGATAGLRHVYFVGEDRRLLTLYRGVPYELPFGINLYQSKYVSSVPVRG